MAGRSNCPVRPQLPAWLEMAESIYLFNAVPEHPSCHFCFQVQFGLYSSVCWCREVSSAGRWWVPSHHHNLLPAFVFSNVEHVAKVSSQIVKYGCTVLNYPVFRFLGINGFFFPTELEKDDFVGSSCWLRHSCICLDCNITEHMRAVYQITPSKAVHLDKWASAQCMMGD